MFNTILVPTDGSELSARAIRAAIAFAKANHAKMVAISVSQPLPFYPLAEGGALIDAGAYHEQVRELTNKHVQDVANAAALEGVPCNTHTAESASPYEEIISAATKYGCDLIFMASHGRKGLSRLFVGSETQKVLAHTTIPVLVFR